MSAAQQTRPPPLVVASLLGAFWGFAGYAVLWGLSPIVVQRPFVISPLGTLLLLPVRIVLWAIHVAEDAQHTTFDFAENNWWIGAVSAVVGAVIVVAVGWAVRLVIRVVRSRGSGGEKVAQPGQGV